MTNTPTPLGTGLDRKQRIARRVARAYLEDLISNAGGLIPDDDDVDQVVQLLLSAASEVEHTTRGDELLVLTFRVEDTDD